MKILVFIACVLTTVAAIVFSDDVKKMQFGYDILTCADTLNLPKELNVQVIKCMFEKNSLIDEQGMLKKDEVLRYFHIIASDGELQRISSCLDIGKTLEESNDVKTLKTIACIEFMLSLLIPQRLI
ncbi:hypothetical protein ACFW04_003732 [Cataglyphis niger]